MKAQLACWIILITCVLASNSAGAQQQVSDINPKTVYINSDFTHTNVTKTARRVFASNSISFTEAEAHIQQWLSIEALSPIPDDTVVWLALSLQSMSQENINLTLLLSNLNIQTLDAYVVDQQGAIRNIIKDSRTHPTAYQIPVDLYPAENIDLFIKIDSPGPVHLPLSLWRTEHLQASFHNRDHQEQFFVGAVLCLLCYFFFSYFLHRNAARFWFTISGLSCLTVTLHLFGFEKITSILLFQDEYLIFVIFSFSLLSSTRFVHKLFFRIPYPLRKLNYVLPFFYMILILFSSAYLSWVITAIIGVVWLLIQLSLCMVFRDRRHTLPSFLFSGGLLLVLGTVTTQIIRFIAESPPNQVLSFATIVVLLIAIILIGMTIDLVERGAHLLEFNHQEQRIANLQHFYDLFESSVEGLYTSAMDGTLLSANKAMCHLFGFTDETTMLDEIPNSKNFYAHPEDREQLLQDLQVNRHILAREIKGKRRDGSEFWFSLSCQVHVEGDNEYLYGSMIDVTDKKQSNMSLEYMATHDSLTGVLNRREFERVIQQWISEMHSEFTFNLLYLDLDRFKLINDSCGHHAGDELIKELAQLIQQTIGNKGNVARLGGDEFAVLCCTEDKNAAFLLASKLLNAVQSYRYIYDNKMFTLGVSIGFLHTKDVHATPEQLLSMADSACYVAKEKGRNQIHQYSPDDASLKRYESEVWWLNKVNQAFENDAFILYCQPYQVLNRNTDQLHFEVLIRMQDDSGDILEPSDFLPIAERYNLGHKIDRWVIENTFKWLKHHPKVLHNLALCNINLSGQSLAKQDLKLAILNAFESNSIPYNKVCFEITETLAVVQLEKTLEFIHTFRSLGCRFALDDFGSGFSSYSYLKNLPVDSVKIDGSFIKELIRDPVNEAMVNSINDIAKAMKMQTVAEFVEDDITLSQLGKIGVDFAQGYAISKPFALDKLSLKVSKV